MLKKCLLEALWKWGRGCYWHKKNTSGGHRCEGNPGWLGCFFLWELTLGCRATQAAQDHLSEVILVRFQFQCGVKASWPDNKHSLFFVACDYSNFFFYIWASKLNCYKKNVCVLEKNKVDNMAKSKWTHPDGGSSPNCCHKIRSTQLSTLQQRCIISLH